MDTLGKIKKIGGKDGLNFVAELYDSVEELSAIQESLPLYGYEILVKDNIDVKGLHTTAGSLALEDNLASKDAPIIANLRKNGAVILGKTNMTEFANFTTRNMPSGYSSRGGQVIHAIDSSLNPSGSSSGSGVAVSSGVVKAAIGTDTSFSIIACAQTNGICGLKPPVGALSGKGIIPIAKTLDSAGPMTQNISDALKIYSAMREKPLPEIKEAKMSDLKLAWNEANLDKVSDGQKDFLNNCYKKFVKGGASITKVEHSPSKELMTIMTWEFRECLEEYLNTSAASMKTLKEIVEYYESHPDTMMKYGDVLLREALDDTPGGMQGKPYLEAMKTREEIKNKLMAELIDIDAVILTGPSNVMHLCGFPSVCVASGEKYGKGINRCIVLYGVDEMRLYSAALAIENAIK